MDRETQNRTAAEVGHVVGEGGKCWCSQWHKFANPAGCCPFHIDGGRRDLPCGPGTVAAEWQTGERLRVEAAYRKYFFDIRGFRPFPVEITLDKLIDFVLWRDNGAVSQPTPAKGEK